MIFLKVYYGKSEIIIYSSVHGLIKFQTRLENETVRLIQAQMATLFGKDRTVITKHITNIFKENELDKKAMCKICTLQIQIV